MRVALLKLLVVLAVIALIVSAAYILSSRDTGPRPSPDEVISSTTEADYIVFRSGPETHALNVTSGAVDYSSQNATQTLQSAIDSLPSSGRIVVKPGTYVLSEDLRLSSDMALAGEGATTVFTSTDGDLILALDQSQVTLADFKMVGPVAIMIAAEDSSQSGFVVRNVTAEVNGDYIAAFIVRAQGQTISDVTFSGCWTVRCSGHGFINIGTEGDSWVRNITYANCQAVGSGIDERYNDWVVGFDLAELTNVDNMTLTDCRADYNWESGFHFENNPVHTNVRFQNCTASFNGQKPRDYANSDGWSVGPLYGAGFFMGAYSKRSTISGLETCHGIGNANGFTGFDMTA